MLIIISNVMLAFDKRKFKLNKYFIMSFISNFLFAVAMLINVNISDNFNIANYIYCFYSINIYIYFG